MENSFFSFLLGFGIGASTVLFGFWMGMWSCDRLSKGKGVTPWPQKTNNVDFEEVDSAYDNPYVEEEDR